MVQANSYSRDKKEKMTGSAHKFALPTGLLVLAIMVFILSGIWFYIGNNRSQSQKPPEDKPINITRNDASVPDLGDRPGSLVAVPKAVLDSYPGSKLKIRYFDISANNNSFSSQKIIVNQNDIINITFTAKDKAYDLTIPGYHITQKAAAGETGMVEFQAVKTGTFVFSCDTCKKQSAFENQPPQGVLLVVPKA